MENKGYVARMESIKRGYQLLIRDDNPDKLIRAASATIKSLDMLAKEARKLESAGRAGEVVGLMDSALNRYERELEELLVGKANSTQLKERLGYILFGFKDIAKKTGDYNVRKDAQGLVEKIQLELSCIKGWERIKDYDSRPDLKASIEAYDRELRELSIKNSNT